MQCWLDEVPVTALVAIVDWQGGYENATDKFYPIVYADDTALSTTLNAFNS